MIKFVWVVIYVKPGKIISKQFDSLIELKKWLKTITDTEYEDSPSMTTIDDYINILRIDPIDYYGLREYKDLIDVNTCSYYKYDDDIELIVDYDNFLFFKLTKVGNNYKAKQLTATEENDNGYKIIRITVEPGKKISTQKIINLVIKNRDKQ